MTRRRWVNLSVGVAALASASCASSNSGGGAAPKVSESSRDKVTSVEIAATPAASAYDLINRLRPQWLRPGGPSSMGGGTVQAQVTLVYLDGSKVGAIDALRSISASGIKTMEWIPAARASIVFTDIGSDAINGAISLKTR
jgi:hypothetical protein